MTETASSANSTPREAIQSTATFMPTTDENGRPLSDSLKQKNTVTVHFNPESLDITFTNSVQKGRGTQSAQVSVTNTTAKLSMELIFDTTLTGLDVRTETNRLARMMDPAQQRPRRNNRNRKVPSIVIFKWGTILFEGYMDTYREKLDFFSSEGVPLRATVTMSMTQQDRSFAPNTNVDFNNNVIDDFTPGSNAEAVRSAGTSPSPSPSPQPPPGRNAPVRSLASGDSVDDAVSVGNSVAAGNSAVARSVATANGIENMRLPEVGELVFPDVRPSAGFGLSLNTSGVGVSLELGGETASLFSNLKQSLNASVGAGVSFSAESHFDVSSGLDANASLGLGGSLDVGGSSSMSADVGVSADIELGIQFEE